MEESATARVITRDKLNSDVNTLRSNENVNSE